MREPFSGLASLSVFLTQGVRKFSSKSCHCSGLVIDTNVFHISFTKAVTKTRGLHRIHGCLRELCRGFSTKNINRDDRDQLECLAGWVRDRISEALNSQRKAYPQDADVLIELTNKYDDKMFTEW